MRNAALLGLGLVALAVVGCVAYYPPPPPPPPPYGGPGGPPPDQGYNAPGSPDQPPPDATGQSDAANPSDQGSNQADDDQGPSDDQQADTSQFYNQLSPYGVWEQTPSYGWVWVPRGVAAGWRPYTVGHWVYSDNGWAWDSDEPFAWAAYHYGRWYDDPVFGWGWVPGPVWAPAWVSWRSGAGYIGWAPLPPRIGWRVGVGLDLGGVDLDVAIDPIHYCFVGEHDFLSLRLHDVLLPFARSVTFVHRTANVTAYAIVNHRVVNTGVPVAHVAEVVGHAIEPVHISAVGARARAGVHGSTLAFYRPAAVVRSPAGRAATASRPPTHPATNLSPDELNQRHQAERQALTAYQQTQRDRLADAHARELAAESTAAGKAQLQQQHAAERNAQQQIHQHQMRTMETHQSHERASNSAPHHGH